MKIKKAKKLIAKYGDDLLIIQKAIDENKEKYNTIDDSDKFLQILIIEHSAKLSFLTWILIGVTVLLASISVYDIYLHFFC